MNRFERRAARGAAYLDRFRPGWLDRIDVGSLDLDSNRYCVLAQVTGVNFYSSRERLAETTRWLIRRGFVVTWFRPRYLWWRRMIDRRELRLRAAWRELIVNRRAAAVLHGVEHA